MSAPALQKGIQRMWLALLLLAASAIQADSDMDKRLSTNLARLLETNSCPGCDLSGLDLSGLNLSRADLSYARLAGANLSGTSLRGARLSHADLRGSLLIDTRLAGADLREADLRDLDIDEAFESMEIIGTRLEGARFKDGVVCGKAPEKGGWGCQHANPTSP